MCIAHNNCMSCPSCQATLSALLINILLGSFQLFLHSDRPLSEGEIIPFSGVCQSGEAALSTPEAAVFTLTADAVQPTTTSSTLMRRPFSALTASANSFVYFASSAATSRWPTHLHVSNLPRSPASVLWHFCRAGLCR